MELREDYRIRVVRSGLLGAAPATRCTRVKSPSASSASSWEGTATNRRHPTLAASMRHLGGFSISVRLRHVTTAFWPVGRLSAERERTGRPTRGVRDASGNGVPPYGSARGRSRRGLTSGFPCGRCSISRPCSGRDRYWNILSPILPCPPRVHCRTCSAGPPRRLHRR